MLKDKLSGIAILEEQVEKLQEAAKVIGVITGHGVAKVEDDIVRLLTPRAPDVGELAKITFPAKFYPLIPFPTPRKPRRR